MNPFIVLLGSCLIGTSAGNDLVGEAPEPAGLRIIEPFDYRGVTLEAGPLKSRLTRRGNSISLSLMMIS